MPDQALLDRLRSARDAILDGIAAGPFKTGYYSYSLDGESYTSSLRGLRDALQVITEQIRIEENTVPGRRELRVVRRRWWW